jgi:tetratricopeptide (TPR) repeat protein
MAIEIIISTMSTPSIQHLEASILASKEPLQQLRMLDQLSDRLIYTDNKKAKFAIFQMEQLLMECKEHEIFLSYLLKAGVIHNQDYDYELADNKFKSAIEILETQGDADEQIEAYIDYVGVCINLDKLDSARYYIAKAQRLLRDFPDPKLKSRLLCREAGLLLKEENYDKALSIFHEAAIGFERSSALETKDYYFQSVIQSGLGNIFERNGDIKKSVAAYTNVVKICEEHNIRGRLSWHYLLAGLSYIALEDYEQAKIYFEQAISTTDDSSVAAKAGAYANAGYCLFEQGETKKALEKYNTAEKIYDQQDKKDLANLFYLQLWKAQAYRKLKKDQKRSDALLRAFEYAKASGSNKLLATMYQTVGAYYAEQKNFEMAYKYQLMYANHNDEYHQEMKARKISEIQIRYDAERKEQESELLRLESKKLQLKALRAQMNPHFIHNALNSIQGYISSNEKENAAKYLAQFASLIRKSLYYSDIESLSLEDEVEFLKEYLSINKKLRYSDQMVFIVKVDEELEEDLICLPSMIVQPYVENALEHGIRTQSNGRLLVEFVYNTEETIKCIIEDNGIGRKKAGEIQAQGGYHEQHKSMGTSITQKRLDVLKSSLNSPHLSVETIDLYDKQSGAALGTRVELVLPVVDFKLK